MPKGPTIFGPLLNCINAKTFLSAYTRNATETKTGTITAIICAIIIDPGTMMSFIKEKSEVI
jgi:hypothetical protein